VQGITGIAPPAGGSRLAARMAWRGLAAVLFGADPSPRRRWRSPWQRRIVPVALGAATLLLCAASVASLADGHGLSPGSYRTAAGSGSAGKLRTPLSIFFRHGTTAADLPHSPLALVGGPMTLQVLVALGVVAPLALAIRYPLLGWRIGWLALLLVPLLGLRWWGGLPWDPVQILVLLVVLYAAGVRHERAALCWLWALTLVPWWYWVLRQGPGVVTAVLGSVAFAGMAVAVDSGGSRGRAQKTLADQAEQIELERARRAVLEERARIGRELHDVVAHHMSMVAVRAESAPRRLGAMPEPMRAEFGALSASAREALADMRRLLGVLRSDQPAARAPQPGLPDLPELIDTARRAGMTVELSAPPALDKVPPSAGVCAYRIIQEALSNAGRHAAGAPIAVSVHHNGVTLTLHVANGPGIPARPRATAHGPGHGLTGMRERAELLGGSVAAGPAPAGGFAVSAVLPLSGSAA
jgi:signal transduction histidine kinase